MKELPTTDWRWWIMQQQAYLRSTSTEDWIRFHWGTEGLECKALVNAVVLAMAIAREHPDNPGRSKGVNFACRRPGIDDLPCIDCPAYSACTGPMTHINAYYNSLVSLYEKAYKKLGAQWKS